MVLSVVGTLDYTGVIDTPLPGETVFAGYALVVIGIIWHYKDRYDSRKALSDYSEAEAIAAVMGSVSDDGYVVDLTSDDGTYVPAELPPLEDLTLPVAGKQEEKVFAGTEIDIAGNPVRGVPADTSAPVEREHREILSMDIDIAGEETVPEKEYLPSDETDIAGEPPEGPRGPKGDE
jgi:hypothetical protein